MAVSHYYTGDAPGFARFPHKHGVERAHLVDPEGAGLGEVRRTDRLGLLWASDRNAAQMMRHLTDAPKAEAKRLLDTICRFCNLHSHVNSKRDPSEQTMDRPAPSQRLPAIRHCEEEPQAGEPSSSHPLPHHKEQPAESKAPSSQPCL